jgi:hypothetical protein
VIRLDKLTGDAIEITGYVAFWHTADVPPPPGDFWYWGLNGLPIAEVRFCTIFVCSWGPNGHPSGSLRGLTLIRSAHLVTSMEIPLTISRFKVK